MEMKTVFSARTRGTTWRKLWLWLAEAERELGLPISEVGLEQMRTHLTMTDSCLAAAAQEEKLYGASALAAVHSHLLCVFNADLLCHVGVVMM